jgi:hypothetical protein
MPSNLPAQQTPTSQTNYHKYLSHLWDVVSCDRVSLSSLQFTPSIDESQFIGRNSLRTRLYNLREQLFNGASLWDIENVSFPLQSSYNQLLHCVPSGADGAGR